MRSTKTEIEEFKESPIWLDILDEMQLAIEIYQKQLLSLPESAVKLNQSSTALIARMGYIDGTIKTFEYVRNELLDIMIADIDTKKMEKRLNLPKENEDE